MGRPEKCWMLGGFLHFGFKDFKKSPAGFEKP